MTPVFSWNKVAYTSEELVSILLDTYQPEQMCLSLPINISHNVCFLVDTKNLQHEDDLKCDDMGVWKHNGSPKCQFHVEKNSRGVKRIIAVGTSSSSQMEQTSDLYTLKRAYYKNASDPQSWTKYMAKVSYYSPSPNINVACANKYVSTQGFN